MFLERLGIQSSRTVAGRKRKVSSKDVHSLRHTFAYMAGCYQIPLPVVQSILGHMSPEMTKHYQSHADWEAKEKYLAQMPDMLGMSNVALLPDTVEAERAELNQLLPTLSLDRIRQVLAFVKSLD